jgi:hypothetical protein
MGIGGGATGCVVSIPGGVDGGGIAGGPDDGAGGAEYGRVGGAAYCADAIGTGGGADIGGGAAIGGGVSGGGAANGGGGASGGGADSGGGPPIGIGGGACPEALDRIVIVGGTAGAGLWIGGGVGNEACCSLSFVPRLTRCCLMSPTTN